MDTNMVLNTFEEIIKSFANVGVWLTTPIEITGFGSYPPILMVGATFLTGFIIFALVKWIIA